MDNPSHTSEIILHERQWEVYSSNARFRVLVAGRRFGKTELALVEILRAVQGRGRMVWYVGPTDRQSKRILWDRLKTLTQRWWSKRPTEKPQRIDLKWGSTIMVTGAFIPDSLRGDGLDFVVLDEFASLRPEAWQEVLRPMVTDRLGRALFIGTPKGRNHFYDQFEYGKTDPNWAVFQFTTQQGGLVQDTELADVEREVASEYYKQEFEGDFAVGGKNRAYFSFDRTKHVKPVKFDMMRPLVWSIDFNVNPMCMLIMQRVDDMIHVLEEIVIKPDANTEAACDAFLVRALKYHSQASWQVLPLTVQIYGDASGNQRRTSGVSTDWALIKQFFTKWRGNFVTEYYTATINPGVRERVACVTSRLSNSHLDARLLVDPSCLELIKDLEQVTWRLDSTGAPTGELDKTDKARTHASDALGYFVSQVFPLKPPIGHQSSGRLL